jgi:Uma2 family endonuclease
VVSSSNPGHDLETKRKEYAQAGIAEYWIVNPDGERITVLRLDEDHYIIHGEFQRGASASSPLLPGFTAEVDAVLDAK